MRVHDIQLDVKMVSYFEIAEWKCMRREYQRACVRACVQDEVTKNGAYLLSLLFIHLFNREAPMDHRINALLCLI